MEQYTVEELAYEYYTCTQRSKAVEENISKNDDKIEDNRMQEALDWAEEEERKELEELKRKEEDVDMEEQGEVGSFDPTGDYKPSKKEEDWMQKQLDEQLEKMKDQYGDDFGEDISG